MSIIPFAKDVNVGSSNWNANWVKFSGDSDTWDENNGKCRNYSGWSEPQTKSSCLNKSGNWTVDSRQNNWNGCVMDRTQPYDVQSDAPSLLGILGTYLPADQSSYCPAQVMPLSYNTTQLKQRIDDMVPAGGTNQPIGLFWGWMTLLQQNPFNAPAKTSGVVYTDVIILMSDGLNTINRWYGNGADPSPEVDARQATLCANIKATGVKIYTIQVNTDGDPESAILKSCASDGQFFPTTTASGIATAFDAIGSSLTKLRVAQ